MTIKQNVPSLIDSPCRLLITLLSLHLLSFSGLAQSSPIVIQPPINGGSGHPSYIPLKYADNFFLESNATITATQWWARLVVPDPVADAPDSNQFNIIFYNDNGGLPGEIYKEFLDVTATRISTSLVDAAGGPVFRFEALTPLDFIVSEQPYYVSIVRNDNNQRYFWLEGENDNDNSAYFKQNDDTSWVSISDPGKLSFSLVPEPSVPALFSIAVLFFVFYHRSIKA